MLGQHSFAQENSSRGIDQAKYNFGFIFGISSNTFRIVNKPSFGNIDTIGLQHIDANAVNGFQVGIISNARLNKYFDLRFSPQVAFVDRAIQYSYKDPSNNISKSIESNYLELPLTLKLKSARHRNVRMYVLAGVKYDYDIISAKKLASGEDDFDPSTRKVKVIRNAFSYEFGFGFDLYYPYFKFSPEIKFSNGINNILRKENHYYSGVLDQLFLRSISINLNFE